MSNVEVKPNLQCGRCFVVVPFGDAPAHKCNPIHHDHPFEEQMMTSESATFTLCPVTVQACIDALPDKTCSVSVWSDGFDHAMTNVRTVLTRMLPDPRRKAMEEAIREAMEAHGEDWTIDDLVDAAMGVKP